MVFFGEGEEEGGEESTVGETAGEDIGHDGEARDQVELLENHAHVFADLTEVVGGDGEAVDGNFALRRRFEAVDAAKEGRFSGTAWAEDDEDFAFVDLKADILEGLDAVGEGFAEVFDADEGHLSATLLVRSG